MVGWHLICIEYFMNNTLSIMDHLLIKSSTLQLTGTVTFFRCMYWYLRLCSIARYFCLSLHIRNIYHTFEIFCHTKMLRINLTTTTVTVFNQWQKIE